jgi:hypothetical protein
MKRGLFGAGVFALLVLGLTSGTAPAGQCGTCWWRLEDGAVTGPGKWVCSGTEPYWCQIGQGSCIDGDGGCGHGGPDDGGEPSWQEPP